MLATVEVEETRKLGPMESYHCWNAAWEGGGGGGGVKR